jgi:UTP:GlnB (protein PII) uridylyltransferase
MQSCYGNIAPETLASKFSQHECNIQVVLIDTQGPKAIDVFYLLGPQGKIDEAMSKLLQEELLEVCRER